MNTPAGEAAGNLSQTLDKLTQLERRGWWSWGAALAIVFALTIGITVLSRGATRDGVSGASEFELAIRALWPIVVIFAIFAIRQQASMTRLRQELAIRIGMTATMEVLRAPTAQEILQRQDRRRAQRYFFDQRVKVKVDDEVISGRIRDISHEGLGVVIPKSLPLGSHAVVEFNAGEGESHTISSEVVLKHSHGFYHGFEFLNLSPAYAESLKAACRVAVDLGDGVVVGKGNH
ncbi:MAG TPA: PilZ domain-containing protein [Terriglobales bacterium]|nr:PilZ domain-containing protein [Terriglobales bacterium]